MYLQTVIKRKSTFSLLSMLTAIIFLAGSTGITIILHNCQVCDDSYVKAGLLISPVEPVDDCCEAAENNCSPDGSITVEGTCCYFRIENLKLNNYTSSISYVPVPAVDFYLSNNRPLVDFPDPVLIFPGEIHNKHGGRFLITINCQIIS